MLLIASASGSRFRTSASHLSGCRVDLVPSFRRYNGMCHVPSPDKWTSRQNPQPNVDVDVSASDRRVDSVASPCDGTCVLSAVDETCLGCFRTKAEIAGWIQANEQQRATTVEKCARRRIQEANPQGVVRPA